MKWLNDYSSMQSILIVGDGDFSFSLALATAFGSGYNLVATSLDSYGQFIISPPLAAGHVVSVFALVPVVLNFGYGQLQDGVENNLKLILREFSAFYWLKKDLMRISMVDWVLSTKK